MSSSHIPKSRAAAAQAEATPWAVTLYGGVVTEETWGHLVTSPFDAEFAGAYEAADWSRYEQLPAFEETNRRNAYQVFLLMEAEALS